MRMTSRRMIPPIICFLENLISTVRRLACCPLVEKHSRV